MSDTSLTEPNPVAESYHELHRGLGPVSLIMIGIGSIIGAGIFVIAGTAAAEHAGPAVAHFIHCCRARVSLCRTLLCRIRLDDPGVRQRIYLCLRHDGPADGVVHRLEHGARISGFGFDSIGRLVGLLCEFSERSGHHVSCEWANAPVSGTSFSAIHLSGAIINLPAVVLVGFLTAFLVVGVSESARVNALMVMIKTAIVLLVILVGLPFVQVGEPSPLHPAKYGHIRKVWHQRNICGVGHDLFRLYRV